MCWGRPGILRRGRSDRRARAGAPRAEVVMIGIGVIDAMAVVVAGVVAGEAVAEAVEVETEVVTTVTAVVVTVTATTVVIAMVMTTTSLLRELLGKSCLLPCFADP